MHMTPRIRLLLVASLTLPPLTLGCGSGADSDADAENVRPAIEVDVTPAQSGLRRLTTAQYHNIIKDVFGEELVLPTRLEPDVVSEGLIALGSSRSSISPRGVEQYEEAAMQIATQVTEPGPMRERLIECDAGGPCAREVLGRVGRLLWRRTLSEDELEGAAIIADHAAEVMADFHVGLRYGLSLLLQSPNFLFRAELGEPDPDHGGELRYTDLEMASRLAFFLWNSGPDDALIDAAEGGELATDEGVRTAALRLLESERLEVGLQSFFYDMLDLSKLDALTKDPTIFVQASAEVGPSAREETLRAISHHLLTLDGDYRDLLTTRITFINRKLAAIYGVPAPAREGFGEYEWDEDSPRRGLLGHVSVLASNAHPTSSSATLRGKFIRSTLLCAQVPAPPVDVNTALPEPSGMTRTLRERVDEHLTNPSCAGCHSFLDPIGLGLENFDGLGAYRTEDNGAMIDASGALDGTTFSDPRELAETIRNHSDLPTCLVSTMYRYATGHADTDGEEALLTALGERFADDGHRVPALMEDIVMSAGFRRGVMQSDEGGAN